MGSAAPPPLDLHNVQGDSLVGLPSKTQTYYFFQIDAARVKNFRTQLAHLIPLITTAAQLLDVRKTISQDKKDSAKRGVKPPLLKISGVNVAFSAKGLKKIGIEANEIGDKAFPAGMLADAKNLGDPLTADGTADWVPAFKHGVDGMILVSGDSRQTVTDKLSEIERIFRVGAPSATIHETIRIVGDVRPGKEKGHEHFGFADGISQPAITGVNATARKGQDFVPQGVTLLGREGDIEIEPPATLKGPIERPSWALDGSLISFRYLFQLVPEFHAFLKRNPIQGLEPDKGSELLGARMVGRWMSGAPIDLAPLEDNLDIAKDPERNNDFDYSFKDPDDFSTQDRCPFAAHTRKTYPRNDLEDVRLGKLNIDNRRIIRRGIQFGPEVTPAEHASGKTQHGRGLLFAAYQSNIINGFQFIQQSWANAGTFPPGKGVDAGLDPIIGQALSNEARTMIGTSPQSQSESLTLPTWVVPKGGEYLFSPSLPTLKKVFALGA